MYVFSCVFMNEYALLRMYVIGGRMNWGLEIATNTLQDEVIIAVLVLYHNIC